MSLFKAEHDTTVKTPSRYPFKIVGYRTYPTTAKLDYADDNSIRYRNLLFDLKANNPTAVELFASLLCLIYDELLGGPEAIACVPTSTMSKTTRDDVIALVAQKAIENGLGVVDGSSWLRRTRDVPKAHKDDSMRTFDKQSETIEFNPLSKPPAPGHILLIDDICTSGSTMSACVSRLREQFPRVKVTAFAFGYTGWVAATSPQVPAFPGWADAAKSISRVVDAWRSEAWPLPADGSIGHFFSENRILHRGGGRCRRPTSGSDALWSQSEAEAQGLTPCQHCKPFALQPRFNLNNNTATIHHVDCHVGPYGKQCELLWSLRQGIRLGGKPCKVCMYSWPLALILYHHRRQALLAAQALSATNAGFEALDASVVLLPN